MAKGRKDITASKALPFGRRNIFMLGAGIAILVIGFALMTQPPVDGFMSLTLAPLVLLVGYLVIIPMAIMIGKDKNPGA
jgi:hypothetical protein